MTLEQFLIQFSHNNEVYVENEGNFQMYYRYHPEDKIMDGTIMDWELQYTNIALCEVMCIKNVIREKNFPPAFTIQVKTTKIVIDFVPNRVSLDTAPLWLYNKIHNANVDGSVRELCCKDCFHNYHCPMPQEGYDFNPKTCVYNPDNFKFNK